MLSVISVDEGVPTKEMITLLSDVDMSRKIANSQLNLDTKSAFGQYMTPASVASFMASLFPLPVDTEITLLDPGAGVGSLTSAFVDRLNQGSLDYKIDVDAYEIDPIMLHYLGGNLELCKEFKTKNGNSLTWRIINQDFIVDVSRNLSSIDSLWPKPIKLYSHCIMNPPYKKISSSSCHRSHLRSVGIETVNLYSGFVSLSLLLLQERGQMVAIIPRSFCNGPYYRPFREFLLKHAALKRIHLFGSRNQAFKEDKVLQENVILLLEKNGIQDDVIVSTSFDDSFRDIEIVKYSFDQIVRKESEDLIVHIPTSALAGFIDNSDVIKFTLEDVGVQISTGPVVDFRMREHLRKIPEQGAVPLLYPSHFKGGVIQWPIKDSKKANAIACNSETSKWLYPRGFYTVIRRFSSKEEKRRIVASVFDPNYFKEAELFGFENHLNIFHCEKKPLSEHLARGLAVFLNSTSVETNFRRFSGHTQVNATDLKIIRYPSRKNLIKLGEWVVKYDEVSQEMIDEVIGDLMNDAKNEG